MYYECATRAKSHTHVKNAGRQVRTKLQCRHDQLEVAKTPRGNLSGKPPQNAQGMTSSKCSNNSSLNKVEILKAARTSAEPQQHQLTRLPRKQTECKQASYLVQLATDTQSIQMNIMSRILSTAHGTRHPLRLLRTLLDMWYRKITAAEYGNATHQGHLQLPQHCTLHKFRRRAKE